ncbi:unnamed protein product [Arctogadus glacialis]
MVFLPFQYKINHKTFFDLFPFTSFQPLARFNFPKSAFKQRAYIKVFVAFLFSFKNICFECMLASLSYLNMGGIAH